MDVKHHVYYTRWTGAEMLGGLGAGGDVQAVQGSQAAAPETRRYRGFESQLPSAPIQVNVGSVAVIFMISTLIPYHDGVEAKEVNFGSVTVIVMISTLTPHHDGVEAKEVQKFQMLVSLQTSWTDKVCVCVCVLCVHMYVTVCVCVYICM